MTENKQFTVKRWYDESAIYEGDDLFAIVDVRIQANKCLEEEEKYVELALSSKAT